MESFDIGRAQGIAMKVLADTTATQMGTLHLIGQRLELFGAVAQGGPLTATELPGAPESTSDTRANGYRRWRVIDPSNMTRQPKRFGCHQTNECAIQRSTFNSITVHYVGGLVHLMPDFWGMSLF